VDGPRARQRAVSAQGGIYDEDRPGGGVCPVAAAAKLAGAWGAGGLNPGWEHWGDPDDPSFQVEEFAAYFDLCSEDQGVEFAIAVISQELAPFGDAASPAPDTDALACQPPSGETPKKRGTTASVSRIAVAAVGQTTARRSRLGASR
jgi:hypothetical protein